MDRKKAEQEGIPGLAALIQFLRDERPQSKINIVAHSMGAWVTLESMRRCGIGRLGQVVLLAPDVPQAILDDPSLRNGIAQVGRLHVFYSKSDEILPYSEMVNLMPILGLRGSAGSEHFDNLFFHDATEILGREAVHGSFVTRDGAAALALKAVLTDAADGRP